MTTNDKKAFDFYAAIRAFNAMYRLEANATPTLLAVDRVRNFENIIREEVTEGLDIAKDYDAALAARPAEWEGLDDQTKLKLLTDMSDWLGDIVVYVASEALRWGIPLPEVLEIIMASNASKLGTDGQPIYDERGKVMKGPGYWKPEPKIQAMLQERLKKP